MEFQEILIRGLGSFTSWRILTDNFKQYKKDKHELNFCGSMYEHLYRDTNIIYNEHVTSPLVKKKPQIE